MKRHCPKCAIETERYDNGSCKPCNRARAAKWSSSNKEHVAAYREANREHIAARKAAWNADNKEHKRKVDAVYRDANREKVRAASAKWRAENPERVRAASVARYAANPEPRKASTAAWASANRERIREKAKKWSKENQDRRRVYEQNRRSRKKLNGGQLSADIVDRLFKLQRGKCACCGLPLGDGYHLDHIMPLVLGGVNDDSNVQLLRSACNQQKHAKHPIEFMQKERGLLL